MSVDQAADRRVLEFAHTALIVGADRDLPSVLVPELHRSAEIYDEVLLVVSAQTRAALADAAAEVRPDVVSWGEPAAFYQRLGSAYEAFRRCLTAQHQAGRRLHVIAEPDLAAAVDPGFRAERTTAYLAYEAVCNDTYAIGGSAVTCIWDSRDHQDTVIDGIRATHAYELTSTGPAPSPRHLPPERYLAERHDVPARPAPSRPDRDVTLHEFAELGVLRSVMGTWAAGHDVAEEGAEDLVVAVIEVATNGLRHGQAPVRVRAWRDGDTLLVQCDDTGDQPIPATAGYYRPQPLAVTAGGRGLWLARQLADVVTVSSAPGRTSVRLHFPRQLMRLRFPPISRR
ncbi:MEDS domain-containing protein [Actinoplanes sp. NEAU-A12]|uniref:MEDS domain-containing protein n=1 Tax=Actinoplanes sandaracinus TaxID=3045177 RepID=A0ABT6WR71_9ACTN|nr:ATP-binding protein [Actinoplanes sandaracinus]MDI6102233.1 MEDS domain-containing protein [Actinoplanes sandaracinus]